MVGMVPWLGILCLEEGRYGSLAGHTWKVGMVPWLGIPGRWLVWFPSYAYLVDVWCGSLAGYTWWYGSLVENT